MPRDTQRPFNRRAFVALTTAAAGLGLPVTGTAVHLLQEQPATYAHHAWSAAHTVLGLLFVVLGTWHALLNSRALLNYARTWARQTPRPSREAVGAVLVVGIALLVAVGHAAHVR